MTWKKHLKADPSKWLLDGENPAIAAACLMEIEELPETAPAVRKHLRQVNCTQPVTAMLANQDAAGYWGDPKKAYQKYEGTLWQFIHLAQFRARPDKRIDKGIEHLVETAGKVTGGFSAAGTDSTRAACLTANCAWAIMRLGKKSHPRIGPALDWLAEMQAEDGGFRCGIMDYSLLPSCTMTVIKCIRAWSAAGDPRRKPVLDRSIQHLLDRELARYVPALNGEWTKMLAEKGLGKKDIRLVKPEWLKREAGKPKKLKPGWLKFGFPRTYNTDLLEILYVLAEAGVPRNKAIDWGVERVLDRQGPDGRWRNDKSLSGKLGPGVEFEPNGSPSRHLTLEALRVLKHYG